MRRLAISYVRYSSAAQAGGISLDRQLLRAQEMADKYDLELDTSHRDEAVSGFRRMNRLKGALASILRKISNKDIPPGSVLIIENYDRLSREPLFKSANLFLDLLNANIAIVTADTGKKIEPATDPREQLSVVMTVLFELDRANGESERRSDHQKKYWAMALKKFQETGRIPTKLTRGWLRLSDDRLRYEPHPDRAPIVIKIFTWTAEGMGCRAIAMRLNREKVPIFVSKGSGWYPSYISKLLRDRGVLGEGGTFPLPQIIPQELWDRCVAVRASQSDNFTNRGRNGRRLSNLLSGLAVCSACGGPMNLRVTAKADRHGHRRSVLYCNSAERHTGCGQRGYFDYPFVSNHILDTLAEAHALFGPEDLGLPGMLRKLDAELADVAAKVAKKKGAIDRLIADFEGEVIPSIRQRVVVLNQEIFHLGTRERELTKDRSKIAGREPGEAHLAAIKAVRAACAAGDYAARARVMQALGAVVDRVVCVVKPGRRRTVGVLLAGGSGMIWVRWYASTRGIHAEPVDFVGWGDHRAEEIAAEYDPVKKRRLERAFRRVPVKYPLQPGYWLMHDETGFVACGTPDGDQLMNGQKVTNVFSISQPTVEDK